VLHILNSTSDAFLNRVKQRHSASTTWMRTVGTALFGVQRCSLMYMWTTAQDGRSVHGLLYLAAVRDGSCQQERRQGRCGLSFSAVGPVHHIAQQALRVLGPLDAHLSLRS